MLPHLLLLRQNTACTRLNICAPNAAPIKKLNQSNAPPPLCVHGGHVAVTYRDIFRRKKSPPRFSRNTAYCAILRFVSSRGILAPVSYIASAETLTPSAVATSARGRAPRSSTNVCAIFSESIRITSLSFVTTVTIYTVYHALGICQHIS